MEKVITGRVKKTRGFKPDKPGFVHGLPYLLAIKSYLIISVSFFSAIKHKTELFPFRPVGDMRIKEYKAFAQGPHVVSAQQMVVIVSFDVEDVQQKADTSTESSENHLHPT